MAKILIIYSTTDGHTRKICRRLQQMIEQQDHRVMLISIDDEPNVDLKPFDKVVLGASIRYGKHSRQVYEFIKRNEQILNTKPNAFFSVNVVARKSEKNQPETNPYLKKFLKQISWRPKKTSSLYRENRLPEVSLLGQADDTGNHVDDKRTYRS